MNANTEPLDALDLATKLAQARSTHTNWHRLSPTGQGRMPNDRTPVLCACWTWGPSPIGKGEARLPYYAIGWRKAGQWRVVGPLGHQPANVFAWQTLESLPKPPRLPEVGKLPAVPSDKWAEGRA